MSFSWKWCLRWTHLSKLWHCLLMKSDIWKAWLYKQWNTATIRPSSHLSKHILTDIITLLHLWERTTLVIPLRGSCQLSISCQCFHSACFQKSIWFLQFSSPSEEKQTDVIAISLEERQHRCVNKAWLLQSKWSLSKQRLCGVLCGWAVIQGHALHGVAPGLQTDHDSSSHYKSGSDHPNTENK